MYNEKLLSDAEALSQITKVKRSLCKNHTLFLTADILYMYLSGIRQKITMTSGTTYAIELILYRI